SRGRSRVAVHLRLTLCRNLSSKRGLVHVVDEGTVAFDLDHRKPFAVLGLERRIVGDVDLLQLERHLDAHTRDDVTRPLAEVTAGGVVKENALHARSGSDPRPGPLLRDRCRASSSPRRPGAPPGRMRPGASTCRGTPWSPTSR